MPATDTPSPDLPSPDLQDDTNLTSHFVGSNASYYEQQFERIGNKSGFTFTFNTAAAVLGPIWYGLRGIWNWMFAFAMLEAFAFVQIGRGLWGALATDERGRLSTVLSQIKLREEQLAAAKKSGADNVDVFQRNIQALQDILGDLQLDIQQAEDTRLTVVAFGVAMLLAVKLAQGTLANTLLERQFFEWLSDRTVNSGIPRSRLALSLLFVFSIYVTSIIRFTAPGLVSGLAEFPTDPQIRLGAIHWIEVFFNFITRHGESAFDGVAAAIRWVLDGLDLLLVQTPWIIIFVALVTLTGLSAGRRSALWTGSFLIYMGLVGLWDEAMTSLALLGAAASISICFGIPLGMYCARRPRLYNFIRPVMDLMQTMPAFVYMIPVIAFFGTGKVSAVIITIVFGSTPVVRLTVLGLRGVPETIREAVIAFGGSHWYLLRKVDLPLAAPSIRAGVNQTILLSLATVVLASLIGAKGLGEDILEALQYASVGQGILAGFAILFLSTILDRAIQGQRPDK